MTPPIARAGAGCLACAVALSVACERPDDTARGTTPPARAADPGGAGYPVTVRGNSFAAGDEFLDENSAQRAIVIAARPERIVVVGPPLYTEILFALDAGDRVVGVSDSPDNPAAAARVPRVGAAMDWSLERVVALAPDVVFGASKWGLKLERDFEIPVVTLGGAGGVMSGFRDVIEAIRAVDRVVHGSDQRSAAMVERLEADIDAVRSRVAGRPRVAAAVVYVPRQFAPTAAGQGTPEAELITLAGARNAFADVDGYRPINLEVLILRDPDVIVTNVDQVADVLRDPRLASLQAIKQRKVFGVKSSQIPSSRFPAILRELADRLHPDLAED